ncbi:MAG: 4Fe-4S binding protein [Bacteroidales bacterium]|nr:4Fe-4S binding protein [Bacteroidales bacterium]MDD4001608.1 4Fe-4S binding protein [Bacteroidales bacterium]MDD4528798.1 4Fe-4S binding protein [Bacteroidales bacterium]MDD4829774.1 4Fe-4S binding protein [Bacteroidales bacterium]
MKRTVIKIDEDLCNGCGLCVTGCHEGALQLIDGKAVMISDMFCDGLGACIGECPVGAIELEEREAEPYDEIKVMERMVSKGEHVILAHLKHMKDHNETEYLRQGIEFLKQNNIEIDLSSLETKNEGKKEECKGGCPGSMAQNFSKPQTSNEDMIGNSNQKSELTHWPIQLHLQNPMASYFQNANVLLAADCTAFSIGAFHSRLLKNKVLSIACPKLDSNKEVYVEKITSMIDSSKIDTLTVVVMEVPCCGGLVQIAKLARQNAQRNIPIKIITIGIKGDILEENWV